MYKITHIDQLGTDYTVSDQSGKIVGSIQVIPHSEILDAALGPYTDDFKTMQNYLAKSIEVLAGYEDVDPHSIFWYSTSEEEASLPELIEFAINHGYNKIIMEHLEELE